MREGAPLRPLTMRATETEIVELARDIVTNRVLVADLSKREWRDSLALIFSNLEDREGKIGLVLVPMAPHASGYWINSVAPAVTWECRCVHVNDLDRLRRTVEAMEAVIWPPTTRKEPHEQRREGGEPGDNPVHDHPA